MHNVICKHTAILLLDATPLSLSHACYRSCRRIKAYWRETPRRQPPHTQADAHLFLNSAINTLLLMGVR